MTLKEAGQKAIELIPIEFEKFFNGIKSVATQISENKELHPNDRKELLTAMKSLLDVTFSDGVNANLLEVGEIDPLLSGVSNYDNDEKETAKSDFEKMVNNLFSSAEKYPTNLDKSQPESRDTRTETED